MLSSRLSLGHVTDNENAARVFTVFRTLQMNIWSETRSVVSDSCYPVDYTVHGILQARILEPFPSPGHLPSPGIKPRFPTLQEESLPAELQGKPKNTVVGSLALL